MPFATWGWMSIPKPLESSPPPACRDFGTSVVLRQSSLPVFASSAKANSAVAP